MRIRPIQLQSFWYRGMIWESGKRYRNATLYFRNYYDKESGAWLIQVRHVYEHRTPSKLSTKNAWFDFCKAVDAKDLKEI